MGLATKKYNLQNELGSCNNSWALRHDGVLLSNNKQQDKISQEIEEGDVIVSFRYTLTAK